MSRKKVVIVEGLISGGKTTLSRELGAALGENTLVLTEPDEKNDANPYLADYYQDTARWSFALQAHMLSLRYRMHLRAQWFAMEGGGHAVLDRSFYGDTAFARLQLKLGVMTQREFNTYSGLYHAMTASVLLPTVCLRVLVSPETAIRRIESRMQKELGRKCESAVSIDYLRGLDREIDHMVGVLRSQGVTILDVPWDADRDSPEIRHSTVTSLAARIEATEPSDFFLDLHRRAI
ncbi:MAG: deoxynucleoside kinase [Bacteroidota bacterium]